MAMKVGIPELGRIGAPPESHHCIVTRAAHRTSAGALSIPLCSIVAGLLNTMKLAIDVVIYTVFAFEGDYIHRAPFGTPRKSIPHRVDYDGNRKICFVIMPFMKSFDGVYFEIKKAVESRGMKCLRADETFGQDILMDTIMTAIRQAVIVIADISLRNPNVLYELGCAHALGKKTILLRASGGDKIPSDLCHRQYIQYENTLIGGPDLHRKLEAAIDNIMESIAD